VTPDHAFWHASSNTPIPEEDALDEDALEALIYRACLEHCAVDPALEARYYAIRQALLHTLGSGVE
jgi:hypothetical protein